MKLRNTLAATAGVVGATALINRTLRTRAKDFHPFLEGEQGTYRWRGFDVAYTEMGDPGAEDLILFHGTGAVSSGHEFWRVTETLSDEYHVIVPDLPGFGQSDRPPLLYSSSLYVTFVGDAIEELTDDDPVVVTSSLTGSYAAMAAEDVDVERLVLVCPTASSMGDRQVWLRALLRSPVVGEGLYNLMVSKPSIRHFHDDHGYYDMDNLADRVVEYEWTSGHQPGARFAPASFVSGFLDPDEDLGETLASVDDPVMLVWGRHAETSPLSEGRDLAEQADTGLVVFDRSKLLPHVEQPDQFVDVVKGDIPADQ